MFEVSDNQALVQGMQQPSKPLVVACYGAGTNSTAFLVGMAQRGEPVDAILFADTGGDPSTFVLRQPDMPLPCGCYDG